MASGDGQKRCLGTKSLNGGKELFEGNLDLISQ